jgi:murein DD-endopeptidase MepM/ murein hydrolase activator NlpD
MPGVITQGVREGHPAIDIACIPGTPVRAAHDGKGRVHRSHTHGITFELLGPDGLETSYSHLNTAMPAGFYARGEQIGTCGNTGIWSSGPHLHFETNRPSLLGSLVESDTPSMAANGIPLASGGSAAAIKRAAPPAAAAAAGSARQ